MQMLSAANLSACTDGGGKQPDLENFERPAS